MYDEVKAWRGPPTSWTADHQQQERQQRQHEDERRLWEVCQPHVTTKEPMSRLCQRVERFLPELFVFVADRRVPSDNNAAERSLRGLVVSRKISGGTRSDNGSNTKSILASLDG